MIRLHGQSRRGAHGFTLIEMLVYLAIFMVVSTASVTFLLSLDDFINQYRLETILYRSSTSVLEPMLLAIRQADQVDLVNTVEDDSATGKLTVRNAATSTSFAFTGGTIEYAIAGEDYGSLLGEGVTVDGFTVYSYDVAEVEFVRVRLTLTATLATGETKSITVYGGSVVRGSI